MAGPACPQPAGCHGCERCGQRGKRGTWLREAATSFRFLQLLQGPRIFPPVIPAMGSLGDARACASGAPIRDLGRSDSFAEVPDSFELRSQLPG
jgi:hypothetical protein